MTGAAVGVDADTFAAELAAARLAAAGRCAAPRVPCPAHGGEMHCGPDCPEGAHYHAPAATHTTAGQPASARCRAGCGVPLLDALADPATGLGLHTGCTAPDPPASTLAEVRSALIRYESARPRTVQKTLGPSELGSPCDRQIALKLAGVQRHERGLPWAPMCGTAVHSLMEDVLTAENERLGRPRWIIEQKLWIGGRGGSRDFDDLDTITGHGDAYDSDTCTVVDWKYTGPTARKKAARRSVPNAELVSPTYRTQGHLYGYGHENAGRRVTHIRIVMLARSHDFDESVEWTEEYRPDIAVEAMTRFYAIRDQVINSDATAHPERLIDVPAEPGDECRWCPFQRPTPPGGLDVDATGCVGKTARANDPAAFFK